jgi:formamidopyrimidine-DNA glycosylase
MPELPEVETVKRQLHAGLAGKTIESVTLLKSGREKPAGKRFVEAVIGKTIEAVERRAKLLVYRFTDGTAMTAHLKMTGKFVFVDVDYASTKHDRMIFEFGDTRLVWNDVRQFGFVHLVSGKELEEILSKYGPEPLITSKEQLAKSIERPKTRMIKAALLNQEVIAGVGNIYADEACHRAGILPMRRLGKMKEADRINLMRHLKELLDEAVKQRGTSANDYVDTEGKKGGFLSLLRVYGREGEKCLNCGDLIKRIVVAQRGTHYCGGCQK